MELKRDPLVTESARAGRDDEDDNPRADHEPSDGATPDAVLASKQIAAAVNFAVEALVRRLAAGDHAARDRRSQLRGNRRAHELPDRHRPVADLPGSRGDRRAAAAVARHPRRRSMVMRSAAGRAAARALGCRRIWRVVMAMGLLTKRRRARRLSALADGELDGDAGGAAFGAWRSDAEARRDWHAWHLDRRRAALRRPGLGSERATCGFCVALRARLATEPVVLAPAAVADRRRRPHRRVAARAGRWMFASAVAAGFVLVAGTFAVSRTGDAPAPAPVALADGRRRVVRRLRAPTDARPRRGGARSARRRRAAGRRAGRQPHDPRRPTRPLSGRPQAVRRQLGARRAVGVPAQRDRRLGIALTRRARVPACRRSADPRLGGARAGRRRRAAQVGGPALRRRRRARCAPGCCASTTPRAGATSRAPSSSAAAAASRAPASRTSAKDRTSTSASSRSTAGSARSIRHNDVVQTVWPGSHVAMIEQRGMLSSFPALLQAGDDGIAEWYDVQRRGQRAGRRPRGRRARDPGARQPSLRLPPLGRSRLRACCCAPKSSASAATCSRPRRSPTSSIGIRPQPESVRAGDEEARRLSRRQAGADADAPRDRRLDDAPGRARLSPGELRQPADRSARRRRRPAGAVAGGDPDHLLRRPHLRLGLHRAVSRRTPRQADVRRARRDLDPRASARATGG